MKNIRLLIILTLLIFISASFSTNVYSQNQSEWVTGQRDKIPDWVFSQKEDGRYIGISDPCLDSLSGEQQAIMRAWVLSLFENRVKIGIVKENFDYATEIASYTHVSSRSRSMAKLTLESATKYFKKGRVYNSLFGETYIELFEVNNMSKADYIVSSGGSTGVVGKYILIGGESTMFYGNMLSELAISCNINDEVVSTSYKRDGSTESWTITSLMNNHLIQNKNQGRYWYDNSTELVSKKSKKRDKDAVIEPVFITRHSLIDGLWSALYESLISEIVNFPYDEFVNKTVGQIEESGYEDSDSSTAKSMIRSISQAEITVCLNRFAIKSDKLEVVWDSKKY